MSNWKRLATGSYIDLDDLTEEDIDIEDINTALNWSYRFSGHHKDVPPLTVAQHTLLCCNLADVLFTGSKQVKLACALHDFGEAYYGDITTPVKRKIGKDALRKVTEPVDKLIYKKFWPYPEAQPQPAIHSAVKVCDLLSMDIERRTMWRSQLGKDKWPETPDNNFTLFDKQQLFEEVSSKRFVNLKELINEN